MTVGGLLLRGTPLGIPLSLLGLANRFGVFDKDDVAVPQPNPFAEDKVAFSSLFRNVPQEKPDDLLPTPQQLVQEVRKEIEQRKLNEEFPEIITYGDTILPDSMKDEVVEQIPTSAVSTNLMGLLSGANVGSNLMQRYNVPQDFEPRIETSPVEADFFGLKKNITDSLLATVQESLGDDYVLPPVSEVGDPVTLTNPILFGKVPKDYIPTFKDNITPTISLLATTGGQDIRANQLTPDNQREFFELLNQFRGQANPLGLNIGFR